MPVPATPRAEADLVEIFSSIQGEGVLVGWRQIFIRFAGCNLDCRYCDTDFAPRESCLIEAPPGSGMLQPIANPVAGEKVLELVRAWENSAPGAYHSISLTGGEPLLQADTLASWLPSLRSILPIYLETNGTLPEQLATLLPHLDWVSMDIKLFSQTGLPTDWELHRRFLQLAQKTNCYVKMVVGENTPDLELQQGAQLLADLSAKIPLILQPVTSGGKITLSTVRLLEMQQRVAAIHKNLRIIPQTHRFMALL
jgi:organic radical activating enzyme